MSKIGRAVQWIQENDLENDPQALTKYIEHQEENQKKENQNGHSKDSESGEWKEARDLPNGGR
jgi:hypothetical protein